MSTRMNEVNGKKKAIEKHLSDDVIDTSLRKKTQ